MNKLFFQVDTNNDITKIKNSRIKTTVHRSKCKLLMLLQMPINRKLISITYID